jgi:rhodanese-related sulfurtransferase
MHTPGHSPESISLVVFDRAESATEPHAVLTGDTLFIGDVGRPDLRASLGWTSQQLGELLYDSLHDKLLKLPDATLIYPAHGAGSLCGKQLSEETVSTLGVQRLYNYALQDMTRDDFVRIVTADQPDAPDYFTYDAILNTKEHPTLDRSLERGLKPLGVDEAVRLGARGVQLVDVREPADFAGAHWAGSLNIPLDGKYATWAGTLLSPKRGIALLSEPGREEEAATRLGRIGFDDVLGYLDGGMGALEGHLDLMARTRRITAATLAEQMAAEAGPLIVDVRGPGEYAEEHIDGSRNEPLNHLISRAGPLAAEGCPIVVHCASGYRSSIAVSLLMRELGGVEVYDLVGGLEAWKAADLAVLSGAAA